ncbi:MAG: hypothetical protein M1831_004715 [Alyxoria varia]|nr:MAG: hypothetical protein M1831_004715 [Alyxoria varia]
MSPSDDVEKAAAPHAVKESRDDSEHSEENGDPPQGIGNPQTGRFQAFAQRFKSGFISSNFEARGIKRVEPSERHTLKTLGYTQVTLFWFSINLASMNVTLGMLGPVVFYLSFLDASLCAVFGILIGCLPVAYIATFGPRSGNRALVFARYIMGWWPAKLIVILNIIVLLGYSLIDTVIAGQILSAVSPNGSLSVVVGIVITAIMTWVVTTFGYKLLHHYERYTWLSQLIIFCILAGVAGPKFNLDTPTQGDARTRIGSRLSFFSLCLAAAITYSGAAADFFVYYPESTPGWKVAASTLTGLYGSFAFALILGIGLGSGTMGDAATSTWTQAYETSQGALIVEGFNPLGNFGKFCSVIAALGLVANLIPPTYASGVDFQILGRHAAKVPRAVWNTFGVIVYTVCALAGRSHLAEIFTNFLALMGYWVSIWIAITLMEHLIFRRWLESLYRLQHNSETDRGFEWKSWNDRNRLPIGIASLLAFLVGWAGAIVSMAQVWYIGPLAADVGEHGADMGNYVGFAWAVLVYLPARYLELRHFGR